MPTPPLLQTTRLENLGFEPDGARFDLDGRTVRIKKDIDPASVAALRGFHLAALADYESAPRVRSPGIFSKLKAWFGRLFSASPRSGAAYPYPEVTPVDDTPPRPPVLPVAPEPQAAAAPHPQPGPRAYGPAKPVEPHLRAVFADRDGMHLVWQRPEGGQDRQVEYRYPLDSELAQRLQTCYGHLDRLGYKVVGLDLLHTGRRGPEKSGTDAVKAAVCDPEKTPEKREPTVVMRLHPEPTDQPDRALVSPAEDTKNLQVLVAPERLLKALRNGADPQRPEAERVTYLRCSAGKSGLKVVDVGLGEGKDQAPSRWEEVAKWLPAVEPSPAPKRVKVAAPAPSSTPSPLPELNL